MNVLPLIFPNAANKVQRKIEENARRAIEQHEDENQPRVKVFFPWKAMLIGSIVLTVLVNFVGFFHTKGSLFSRSRVSFIVNLSQMLKI